MITMPEAHAPSRRQAARRGTNQGFDKRLQRALRQCAAGEPSALLYLEVAGAWDVRDAGGQDAASALREAVGAALAHHVHSPMVSSPDGLCGYTVLFERTPIRVALAEARTLKHDVDGMRFRWRGHPFRLSAYAGLLELGSEPLRCRYWLGAAREACAAARELAGSGVQLVELNEHAWSDIARNREWVQHLSEIIG